MAQVTTMLSKLSIITIILASLLLIKGPVRAQEQEGNLTLSQSYNMLYQKAETYNEYKVFKISLINTLWKNVQDSLNFYKGEIASEKDEITNLNNKITELNARIGTLETTLDKTRNVADSISVLGLLIPKVTYNIIVWCIILGLCVVLAIGYATYKWSNKRYSLTRNEFHKLLSDFERFKKSAQEKKIRLGRELQTERNKVVELESRLRGIDGNI